MSEPIKFGAAVTANAVLRRRTRIGERNTDEKYWDAWAIKPRTGLYIGARTLSNGVRWYEPEVGMVYEAKGAHFRAALVVFSAKEKPVLVPFDSLEAQP
jgi:hypothetical protein